MNVFPQSHRQARLRLLIGLGMISAGIGLLFTPLPEDPVGRYVVGGLLGLGILDAALNLAWFISHPIKRRA